MNHATYSKKRRRIYPKHYYFLGLFDFSVHFIHHTLKVPSVRQFWMLTSQLVLKQDQMGAF